MIVADKKPIEEIIETVSPHERILILGCNECVTVCEAGGKKEVIVSIACGVGVQFTAEKYHSTPVYPGVNTSFMGVTEERGLWTERCQGCGTCILARTGGICPVSRCAKRIMNGPCGGSTNGRCEITKDVPCGWQLIIDRLAALGRMDTYETIQPIKDWSTDRAGGPRKVVREDVQQ